MALAPYFDHLFGDDYPPFIGCTCDTDVMLCHILEYDASRVTKEAVSRRWRSAAQSHFRKRRFTAPLMGEAASISMEVDTPISKKIYSAELRAANTGPYGGPQLDVTVTFLDWVPSFLRSNPHSREKLYTMEGVDADSAWIKLCKLKENHAPEAAGPGSAPVPAPEGRETRGILRLEGSGGSSPASGPATPPASPPMAPLAPPGLLNPGQQLSSGEIQDLLELLDVRRNPRLVPRAVAVTA